MLQNLDKHSLFPGLDNNLMDFLSPPKNRRTEGVFIGGKLTTLRTPAAYGITTHYAINDE